MASRSCAAAFRPNGAKAARQVHRRGLLDPEEASPCGEPQPFTLDDMLRFTVILIGGGAAALIAYLISLLASK